MDSHVSQTCETFPARVCDFDARLHLCQPLARMPAPGARLSSLANIGTGCQGAGREPGCSRGMLRGNSWNRCPGAWGWSALLELTGPDAGLGVYGTFNR